jgi:5'-deoxynucleotidase YfbR-like HD superfamily hydrolase
MDKAAQKILNLEITLRRVFDGLLKHSRWDKTRSPNERKESVAEHMFKMNIIAQIMLDLEQKAGNPHNLDYLLLLRCCVNHDIGEWENGDTPIFDKTHHQTQEENQAHTRVFDTIIPQLIRDGFGLPLDQDPRATPIHKKYWRAIELVGYCLYALEQVRQGYVEKNKLVLAQHQHELDTLAEIFQSVEVMRNIIRKELKRLSTLLDH